MIYIFNTALKTALNTYIFFIACTIQALTAVGQNLDINTLRSINRNESVAMNYYTNVMANLVTPMSIGLPLAIYGYHAIKNKKYIHQKSFVIGASLITAAGISTTLKYTINRTRPFITYPDLVKRSTGGSPSFPSGHTSSAFSLATSVAIQYPKWYVVVPSCIWAGSVAYSRMYQGVHYPSDVLAGAVIGSGSAVLCYYLNKKLFNHSKKIKS